MCRVISVWVLLVCAVSLASAQQNHVYQHNLAYQDQNDPNLPNLYYYDVVHLDGTLSIHHGIDGEEFWFDAAELDGSGQYAGPGHIESIAADADAGVVAVRIAGSGHAYGAQDVDAISLVATGVVSDITGLTVRGNLGTDGPIDVTHLSGTCVVGVEEDTGSGYILDDVTVQCFTGTLACRTFTNLLAYDECAAQSPAPSVTEWGNHTGMLEMKQAQGV